MKLKSSEIINDELTYKIENFLQNYLDVNWNPKHPNTEHHSFI